MFPALTTGLKETQETFYIAVRPGLCQKAFRSRMPRRLDFTEFGVRELKQPGLQASGLTLAVVDGR